MSLSAVDNKKHKHTPSPTVSIPKGPKVLFQVRANYDFPGYEEGELPLFTGQVVDVYDNTTFHEWWKGGGNGKLGIFPSNYVEKIEPGSPLPRALPSGLSGSASAVTDEAIVAQNASYLDRFASILERMAPHESVLENDELQDNYQKILAMRPKIIKLLHSYQIKNGTVSKFVLQAPSNSN